MNTHINYYTNEEAYTKVCPDVKTRLYKGKTQSYIFKTFCKGSICAGWLWHEELNDDGLRQGHCGKLGSDSKLK